jgi:hypothetical protein
VQQDVAVAHALLNESRGATSHVSPEDARDESSRTEAKSKSNTKLKPKTRTRTKSQSKTKHKRKEDSEAHTE